MSDYTLFLSKKAKKQLENLPEKIVPTIILAIGALQSDPRPDGCKKLKGRKSGYRIRIGNYRVLYDIFDRELVIEVITLGHRKDVYE
ncbi:type II toxin-antitoxin system RelE/ParE family toxin [Dyadobacter sp. CY345]|uniref:type II toxin-antitoxin system RelE family toxin n=1 Tax=Dyadobacter sp. CY345 TaxID=2909335 RepID=UPI001F2202DD|nr:type II toxin-antitoxin system RelE/ParE family toxin [Dyadobacter sp. CY345]MCF2445386.1 type II toxin-antitoxin system RelE/ParE family toxin [Dyadobacter sp. CY345]